MNNEELQAKYESLNSMADAYALAQANGFTCSMDDFEALCARAAGDLSQEKMDLDAMEAVAGGGSFVDNVIDWVKENPWEAVGIGVGAVAAVTAIGVGVAYGVNYMRSSADDSADSERSFSYTTARTADSNM